VGKEGRMKEDKKRMKERKGIMGIKRFQK